MPPQETIYTPKELATQVAHQILNSYGFNHPGTVLDYDEAVEILVDYQLGKCPGQDTFPKL